MGSKRIDYVLLPDVDRSDDDDDDEENHDNGTLGPPADGRLSTAARRNLWALAATVGLGMMMAVALTDEYSAYPSLNEPTGQPSLSAGAIIYYNSGGGSNANGCDENWWKRSVIYQIYPRSFQDSDGDGIGDLNGIYARLGYLQSVGINAVWLSPIYASPMKDFGYDVRDYRRIDPIFGTMDDFDRLVVEMHRLGMYLVMDFVPNHSSDEHEWFQKSVKRVEPYTDYYVWHDGGEYNATLGRPNPPNNWVSMFGNSSWQWHPARKQYYYHRFLISQPDLNYYNERVQKEMLDVLTFWMDRGVDGFRIDAVQHLAENRSYLDEPLDPAHADSPPNSYEHLKHIYTLNQPLTFATVKRWADHFRAYSKNHSKRIFSVAEMDWVSSIAKDVEYYSTGVDLPFNFDLIYTLHTKTTAADVRSAVAAWMTAMPPGDWPNWVLGSHDAGRVASRLGGTVYTDLANVLLLLLPGTPTAYYGDEIGMTNIEVSFNDTQDPAGKKWGPKLYKNFSRDPERSPMQWDNGPNAGFCKQNVKPWLPLANNYTVVNVAGQMREDMSHLGRFKALLRLREKSVFEVHGDNYAAYDSRFGSISEPVFAFARFGNRTEDTLDSYLVLLNFDRDQRRESGVTLAPDLFGREAEVAFVSGGVHRYKTGDRLRTGRQLLMRAGDAIVLRVEKAPRQERES